MGVTSVVVLEWAGAGVETLGQRLKAQRERLQMSQSEVARRAGCSHSYINLLESDRYSDPGAKLMDKIAAALGVSVRYLLYGEPDADDQAMLEDSDLALLMRDILATLPDPAGRRTLIDIARRHLEVERQIAAEQAQRRAANG